jgi:hypothetical protein
MKHVAWILLAILMRERMANRSKDENIHAAL